MNPDHNGPSAEDGLRALEGALARERVAARRASRSTLWASLAILLVVCGFVAHTYGQVRRAWAADDVGASLERELQQILPSAVDELTALAAELAPIYLAEAERQFRLRTDRIGEELAAQADVFFADVERVVRRRLLMTVQRVHAETERAVVAAYPELDTPEARRRMVEQVSRLSMDAMATSMEAFMQRFVGDVDGLRRIVEERSAVESDLTTTELQKKFLSLWLQEIDAEIQKS